MAIKVQFPAGAAAVTAAGLYQWDYGQTLEIECAEIGTEALEVHFACHNMTEAVVRACFFESGVGTVEIPDECLEQTSAVTAWLCRSDATQRHTIKVITLPLTARTRPATVRDIPEKYVDSYGQLLSEVSEAVGKLASGEVTAKNAKEATTAGHATTAGSALSATTATTAGSADTLSKLYLHVYQISMDVYANNGTRAGTLYLKLNVTSPKESLSRNLLDKFIYEAQDTPHYFAGFYAKGDICYPIISYKGDGMDGTYFHYTIALAHMSIVGKSESYTANYTTHKLY